MDESVKLRALQLEDIDRVLVWGKDENFCVANGWTSNLAKEILRQHWTTIITSARADFIRYGIVHQGLLVGYADLADVDYNEAHAELGYAIGDSSLWGKGLGFHGAALMLEVAFEKLGLKSVTSSISATNTRSRRVIEKLKFTLEGVQEGETEFGMRGDVCFYRLLLEDFRDPAANSKKSSTLPNI